MVRTASPNTILCPQKVATAALAHDMLLLTTSVYECIRFIPPLNISADEVDLGLERVEVVFDSGLN